METPKISVITPSIRPSGLEIVEKGLRQQTFKDFEWLVDINISDKPDLNASLNRMILRSKGELIVFLQDYIEASKYGLENFWKAYNESDKTVFTAPVGKTDDWKSVQWDWRKFNNGKCNFMEWEIDWACASKKSLFDVGGFDEKLDKYWGFDNVNIGLRLELKGYDIYCLQDNTAVALDHDKIIKHPFRNMRNPKFHNERLDEIRRGANVDYLNDI